MKQIKLIFILCILGLFLTACTQDKSQSNLQIKASNFHLESCGACGMIVKEQSAPRGQIVYKNNYHQYFCSIHDMVITLHTPSPYGKPLKIYVEVLKENLDPMEKNTSAQEWVDVNEAIFVVNLPKTGVMGIPVAAFKSEKKAQLLAKRLKLKTVKYIKLKKELDFFMQKRIDKLKRN